MRTPSCPWPPSGPWRPRSPCLILPPSFKAALFGKNSEHLTSSSLGLELEGSVGGKTSLKVPRCVLAATPRLLWNLNMCFKNKSRCHALPSVGTWWVFNPSRETDHNSVTSCWHCCKISAPLVCTGSQVPAPEMRGHLGTTLLSPRRQSLVAESAPFPGSF